MAPVAHAVASPVAMRLAQQSIALVDAELCKKLHVMAALVTTPDVKVLLQV